MKGLYLYIYLYICIYIHHFVLISRKQARTQCWAFTASTSFDESSTARLIHDDIISSEVGLGLVYVIFATYSGGWG